MGGGLEYGVSATLFERSRDCLRLLDAQAVVHNVILQPYPLQFDVLRTTTVEHFRQKLSRVCGNRPLLGVSVWGIGIADRVVWRLVHELLDPGLRVALYDDTPRTTTSSPVKRTALPFRRFAVSDAVTVGGAAAEHVIAHGHRVIAWISHAPGESWSVARLSGIRSRCREFPGVRVVDGGGPDISKWNVTTLPAVREKIAATLFDGARIPDTMALHNMLDTLSVAYRDCLFETRFVDSVRPLFERLLAMQPRPTVWICSSDALAAHAHDFLRERGMAVPRDISLVGFDDSLDSFHRGIDSYNFNNHGAALAILTHILDPNRSNELWGQRIDIPIEGFVHTRGSVRDIRGR